MSVDETVFFIKVATLILNFLSKPVFAMDSNLENNTPKTDNTKVKLDDSLVTGGKRGISIELETLPFVNLSVEQNKVIKLQY